VVRSTELVEFDLSAAHPDYQRSIPAILLPLTELYPGAKLRSVVLFDPVPGDTSMGGVRDGVIRLNAYWFARDPQILQGAALNRHVVEVGGIQMGWHGPMTDEPAQVLTHEFGHVAWDGLPRSEVEEWTRERFRAATRDPYLSPSGYAMVGNPPLLEFWAEMFALVHMGLATGDEASDMRDILKRLQ
jgi:hypothetical protein